MGGEGEDRAFACGDDEDPGAGGPAGSGVRDGKALTGEQARSELSTDAVGECGAPHGPAACGDPSEGDLQVDQQASLGEVRRTAHKVGERGADGDGYGAVAHVAEPASGAHEQARTA